MSTLNIILRAACAGTTVQVCSFNGSLVCKVPGKWPNSRHFWSYEKGVPAPQNAPQVSYDQFTSKTHDPPHITMSAQDVLDYAQGAILDELTAPQATPQPAPQAPVVTQASEAPNVQPATTGRPPTSYLDENENALYAQCAAVLNVKDHPMRDKAQAHKTRLANLARERKAESEAIELSKREASISLDTSLLDALN